jgi:hypothetical protein
VLNIDERDHKVRIISHYYIRGVNGDIAPRFRERGNAEVRRAGLDMYFVIDPRNTDPLDPLSADLQSKYQVMRIDVGVWTKKKL